jgi:hypothetical protein
MRISDAMRRLIPPGSLVLFLLFLTGVWVTMSPFAMTTQPSGQPWIASTINNVTIGGVLLVVSLLGILAYMALALRDLIRETQAKQEADR